MSPRLWVFAGPNGAGKSTIVDQLVGARIPIVNPDTVARSLPAGLDDRYRIIQAGRLAICQRNAMLASHIDFGIETTLTGHSELELMRSAIEAGYRVSLVYVGLRDVQLSIGRVRERVSKGGHDVALSDLLRRFDRSIANLRVAMTIANHRILLLDNSDRRRRLLLSSKSGRIKYQSSTLPDWLSRMSDSRSD